MGQMKSHTGLTMATVFAETLTDFRLSDQVCGQPVMTHQQASRTNHWCVWQILSVTCDNAASNNMMVHELEILVDGFTGPTFHMCCFLHVVNLVAKSLICQFDVKNKKGEQEWHAEGESDDYSQDLKNLEELYKEIDDGDMGDNAGLSGHHADEGVVNEMDDSGNQEWDNLECEVWLVKFVLAKVASCCSPDTILIP